MNSSIKRNTIYNAIKTISAIIFPMITFPYVSRILTPDNIGKVNFSSSIVSYFSLAAGLGISVYAVRECALIRNDRGKLSTIASQIYTINVFTTIFSFVVLFITLYLNQSLIGYRTLIIIQSLSIIAVTVGTDWINSAMEDFVYITVRTIIFQLISLVLLFVFVRKPDDYVKYVAISLISVIGTNMLNIRHRKKYCDIRFIVPVKEHVNLKKHITSIMLLFVMLLALTLFNSVDITMLGMIKGDYEVGIYSTANKVANLIIQVIVSCVWVFMPRISNWAGEDNYEEINGFLKKILGYFSLLGLPCFVGTICVSHEMIVIMAGKAYSESGLILQILMIGFMFDLFGNSFIGNIICLPLKEEIKFTVIWVVSTLLNIILNYFFIPLYGAKAAAVTTAFSYFISLLLLIVCINKNIKIVGKFSLIMKPIIGCIGIVIACWLLNDINNIYIRVTMKISTGIVVYFFIQYLLNNYLLIECINALKKRKKGERL